MKVVITGLLSITISLGLSGCSNDIIDKQTKEQAISQAAAPYAQGSITLNIMAEPGLNSWNEMANSCTLLVIQAQKSSVLNKVMSSPAELKKLFSGAGAQDNILKVDRYPAMPGQKTTLHIDRSENTRLVAIVAGYYPFPKPQHMVLVAIPVTLTSEGWWKKKWSAALAPLTLDIRLGSQSITLFQGATPEPVVLRQTELAATPDNSENTTEQMRK